MKKLILFVAVFTLSSLQGMELQPAAFKSSVSSPNALESGNAQKEKNRESIQSNNPPLKQEQIALVEQQSGNKHEFIIVHSIKELEELEKENEQNNKLAVNDSQKKRLSVIVMSNLDMDQIAKSEQKLDAISENPSEEEFIAFADFFQQFTHRNVARVQKPFAQKIKEIHQTPPDSPKMSSAELRKLKDAYLVFQQVYKQQQSTSREIETARNDQEVKRNNPINNDNKKALINKARTPNKPDEWLTNHPQLRECVSVLEDVAGQLIDQELETTTNDLAASKTTQKKTVWGGIGATLLTSGVTALITWLGTKKSC